MSEIWSLSFGLNSIYLACSLSLSVVFGRYRELE